MRSRRAHAPRTQRAWRPGEARAPPSTKAIQVDSAAMIDDGAVDPLTVAHQTGTSIAMIEKAYLRFIPVALQQKLAALKEA